MLTIGNKFWPYGTQNVELGPSAAFSITEVNLHCRMIGGDAAKTILEAYNFSEEFIKVVTN